MFDFKISNVIIPSLDNYLVPLGRCFRHAVRSPGAGATVALQRPGELALGDTLIRHPERNSIVQTESGAEDILYATTKLLFQKAKKHDRLRLLSHKN